MMPVDCFAAESPIARLMPLDSDSVTRILADLGAAQGVARELLPVVYDELRRLAASHFADERANHTLQPTALVNEAFLRIAGDGSVRIEGRAHFFRLASKVMRQVLIDHARAKTAQRRGGSAQTITLASDIEAPGSSAIDLLALEEALESLSALSPQKARLVELRFFGGLSIEEAADAIDMSRTQATREWRTARAWLADELGGRAAS